MVEYEQISSIEIEAGNSTFSIKHSKAISNNGKESEFINLERIYLKDGEIVNRKGLSLPYTLKDEIIQALQQL